MEASGSNIAQAITHALAQSQVTMDELDAICLCLAGFDTDLDLPVPQRAIALLGFKGPVIFENDVVGAWAGVTGGEAGIVAIAGTGATALGMNARGEFWRTDGWDYVLGDAGSGYRIGLDGIHEAMKMLDGRRPPTLLAREMAECYGIDDASAMRRLADSGALGKLRIADFARHVSDAADAGDLVGARFWGMRPTTSAKASRRLCGGSTCKMTPSPSALSAASSSRSGRWIRCARASPR
jgi:N-acetylglucosamine kinase-like BadF-type ATPase